MIIEKTTARILITEKCNRRCVYCCNNFDKFREIAYTISDMNDITEDYKEYVITGGEPLLDPRETIEMINMLRETHPQSKVYVYTTIMSPTTLHIMNLCDGVTFTLHDNVTPGEIRAFGVLQLAMMGEYVGKSLRLHLGPNIDTHVPIIPSVWTRIKRLKWQAEDGNWICPCEDVFILKGSKS